MDESVIPESAPGKLNLLNIPQQLKAWLQWVLHKLVGDKPKVPHQPDGSKASVSNPNTWHPFEEVVAAYNAGGFDGIGFAFTKEDPYCGIDLDHGRNPETGEIAPWAQKIIDKVHSYTEVSPSGTGVHIIACASVPSAQRVAGIEIYDRERFFTMTGAHVEGTPLTVEPAQEVITELWDHLVARKGGPSGDAVIIADDKIDWSADPESIRERLEEILAADPWFRRTWNHDRPDLKDQSLSAFDLSLLAQAVLTHGWYNPTDLYLLLRLHREEHGDSKGKKKAQRKDYARRTIGKALAGLEIGGEEEPSTKAAMTIQIGHGQLALVIRQAETALGLANRADPSNGVYRQLTSLVQPTRAADEAELNRDGGQRGRLVIAPMEQHGLRLALAEACPWESYDGRSKANKPADPPLEVARIMLAVAPKLSKIPILTGIVEAPILRPDGSVLDQPGYDPATGLLFDPGGVEFLPLPEAPTREGAMAALEVVLEILSDFPFADETSRSVAVSGLMAALVRRACSIMPLHVYTSGMMGSGKSELASIPSYIVIGRAPAMMGQADTAEENKRALALLMEGRFIIVYDNIDKPLKSDALCILLTSENYLARVLGVSRMADPRSMAVFYVTGNNAVLAGDLPSRALVCALDPDCERPDQRNFKFSSLRDEVLKRRPELVRALLTINRAYRVDGEPKLDVPNFRFKDYCRNVRNPLIWAGMADPCESRKWIEARDPVTGHLTALLTACRGVYKSKPFKVRDAIKEATREPRPGESKAEIEARTALYEALDDVSGGRVNLSPGAVGKFISKYEQRYEAGLRFERVSKSARSVSWRVKTLSCSSPNASKGEDGEVVNAPAKGAGKLHLRLVPKEKVVTPSDAAEGPGNEPHQDQHSHPEADGIGAGGPPPDTHSVAAAADEPEGEPADEGKAGISADKVAWLRDQL